ncbi:MAG TPA: acetyl-CoA carboxylase carboxyltransferase subunit alpha [Candidatus Limnocylindria bacterium]|nr:acetyl-CoA carboxylase carboxyltransferase subunit alpha [Candidatus Limnocylindria bacterium]
MAEAVEVELQEQPQPDAQPRVDADALRAAVWARVQLARNVRRPHTLELVQAMATDVIELHGDRLYRDDPAICGGFCRLDGRRVVFVGHQKGAETDENVRRNFGMPHPEGYRKAMRLFALAERLQLPVVTFIDTPGAFPGPASEERGVAESIARSIMVMTRLRTPVVTVITGEGGSGGALAIAVGDIVLALENAIYSVISPEGCASILWRAPERAQEAAVAMRLTAREQQALGVIDDVIPEPGEGAHQDPAETARRIRERIVPLLDALAGRDRSALVEARYARYRRMGEFATLAPSSTARPERGGLAERLRALLESGRAALGGPDGAPLRPDGAPLRPDGAPLRPDVAQADDDPPLREDV